MNNRVSQSVPHLHVHVVPRRKKDGLRGFFWPRQRYGSEEGGGGGGGEDPGGGGRVGGRAGAGVRRRGRGSATATFRAKGARPPWREERGRGRRRCWWNLGGRRSYSGAHTPCPGGRSSRRGRCPPGRGACPPRRGGRRSRRGGRPGREKAPGRGLSSRVPGESQPEKLLSPRACTHRTHFKAPLQPPTSTAVSGEPDALRAPRPRARPCPRYLQRGEAGTRRSCTARTPG